MIQGRIHNEGMKCEVLGGRILQKSREQMLVCILRNVNIKVTETSDTFQTQNLDSDREKMEALLSLL